MREGGANMETMQVRRRRCTDMRVEARDEEGGRKESINHGLTLDVVKVFN